MTQPVCEYCGTELRGSYEVVRGKRYCFKCLAQRNTCCQLRKFIDDVYNGLDSSELPAIPSKEVWPNQLEINLE